MGYRKLLTENSEEEKMWGSMHCEMLGELCGGSCFHFTAASFCVVFGGNGWRQMLTRAGDPKLSGVGMYVTCAAPAHKSIHTKRHWTSARIDIYIYIKISIHNKCVKCKTEAFFFFSFFFFFLFFLFFFYVIILYYISFWNLIILYLIILIYIF